MAVARYQAQVGTNTDVLDAQSDLSSAEASLITARGDYMISVASLYNATGSKVRGSPQATLSTKQVAGWKQILLAISRKTLPQNAKMTLQL